jgi:WD40 repeat protein
MLVNLDSQAGPLWRGQPQADAASGFMGLFQLHQAPELKFTCAALTCRGTSAVAGDSSGGTWVCHFKDNRYSKESHGAAACTAIATHPVRNEEFIVGHQDGLLVVHNLRTRNHAELLRVHVAEVQALRFSPSGDAVVSLSKGLVVVWAFKVRCVPGACDGQLSHASLPPNMGPRCM